MWGAYLHLYAMNFGSFGIQLIVLVIRITLNGQINIFDNELKYLEKCTSPVERNNVLSLKLIGAYVLSTMAYPHRTVRMYHITTDLPNHTTKIGPRWQ